jgi:hypothetical protein
MSEHYGDKTGTYASMTAPTPEGKPTMTVDVADFFLQSLRADFEKLSRPDDLTDDFITIASLLRDRIECLESRIERLQQRVRELEAKLGAQPTDAGV